MLVNFFDDTHISGLFPLTLTRPAADLRCGILTLAEKWAKHLSIDQYGFICADYLSQKFTVLENAEVKINGRLIPNPALVQAIKNLQAGQVLVKNGLELAINQSAETPVEFEGEIELLSRPFDIFSKNAAQICLDFELITKNRTTAALSKTNTTLGNYPIFVEEGAVVECSILNAKDGPIYIGKNAEIMEGCMIRGSFAMCEGAVLKLATKVYGGSTLGPYSVAGGEINNVVFWGYSNKGHDGFIGNAVLGEWCNIGADSNCSNLKNNYEDVKVWNYASQRFDKSGLQFCGVIMGDHSKCGINTMFNTGTVVGACCNVFGHGFPRQVIPDFSWGGASGMVTHKPDAAFKTAALVMPRRKRSFDEIEKNILLAVFEMTAESRKNYE